MIMRIAVGADHAGYEGPAPLYKPAIMEHLDALGHEVIDCGTNSEASVDYPDYAAAVCRAILDGRADAGVLLCGTGIGISIAANRHKGIRAATCATEQMTRLAREHNNANIICVGRRTLALAECLHLIEVWLETPFNGNERHKRRIGKLDTLR